MTDVGGQTETGLRVGDVIDARYKVVRFIGQGGNGVVHEVEHVLTGRHLALKSLSGDVSPARLEQEARAACLMKNRHAVIVTDMGDFKGVGPYLVMELLEGESLRSRLETDGQLSLEAAVNLALQVCECLQEAHDHGLVHRDLKPDNIFLEPTFAGQHEVKVLDFGVVKIADDGPIPSTSLTRTGSTVGTPFYMSLEQLRDSSNVDARSDVYSFCVVLYESLSGAKPFQAETIGDLVYALCSTPPTPLLRLRPDVPRDVSEVIMRGLSSNHDERPQSMRELATVLASHGGVAFGLWLQEDAPQPTAPQPSALQTTVPLPAGLPRPKGPPPRPPPRPHAEPAAPEPQRDSERPTAVTDLDSTSTSIETPAPSRSGDRDTPTELYVKDVHGVSGPDLGPQPRNTPTEALDAAELSASNPSLEAQAAQAVEAAAAISAAVAPPQPRMGTVRMQGGPAEVQALLAESGSVLAPAPGAMDAAPQDPLAAARRSPLDNMLATIGSSVERAVQTGLTKFRAATPQAQIVVVVVAASVLAVTLVLLVYVAVAPSAPPTPPGAGVVAPAP